MVMRELSLFSGAGGGLLASKHLLGWRTIGYVEFNEYCQKVIKARIADGLLDEAPIFGDIRAFIDQGYAKSYQGMVDVITAGFPCQPFSTAGKQKGEDDERNMWPATIAAIRAIRPPFAFMENVPGLIPSGYFSTVLGDLAEAGYDARWIVLGARHIGAPIVRDRLWILARSRECKCCYRDEIFKGSNFKIKIWDECRADSIQDVIGKWEVAYGEISGVDDGMALDVDRLKAIGNGQVPAVAAAAWRILNG